MELDKEHEKVFKAYAQHPQETEDLKQDGKIFRISDSTCCMSSRFTHRYRQDRCTIRAEA